MSDELPEQFDAILKRMLDSKPLSKQEISAKIKAYREAKKVAKEAYSVQKMDKIKGAKP
jgi:hypothetical protein